MQTFKLRQTTEKMEDPAHWKMMLRGTLSIKKATPRGPDLASICESEVVREVESENVFVRYVPRSWHHDWFWYSREEN